MGVQVPPRTPTYNVLTSGNTRTVRSPHPPLCSRCASFRGLPPVNPPRLHPPVTIPTASTHTPPRLHPDQPGTHQPRPTIRQPPALRMHHTQRPSSAAVQHPHPHRPPEPTRQPAVPTPPAAGHRERRQTPRLPYQPSRMIGTWYTHQITRRSGRPARTRSATAVSATRTRAILRSLWLARGLSPPSDTGQLGRRSRLRVRDRRDSRSRERRSALVRRSTSARARLPRRSRRRPAPGRLPRTPR